MSVVRSPVPNRPDLGEKVELPRLPLELWTTIEKEWAGDNEERWRALAMLHLHVYCRWTLKQLGLGFGHAKGHISRRLREVKEELAERFLPATDEAARRLDRIGGKKQASRGKTGTRKGKKKKGNSARET